MRFVLRIVLLTIALFAFNISAEDVITLDNQKKIDLTSKVQVYEDASEALKIADVSAEEFSVNFHPVGKSFEFPHNSQYWLKLTFSLAPEALQPRAWVIHINKRLNVETLRYYESLPDGSYRKVITGRQEHYLTRDIPGLDLAFKMIIAPEELKTVYIQVHQSNIVGGLPLELKAEQEFAQANLFSWITASGYYSILAALFLYYIIQLIFTSSDSNIAYAVYIAATALAISSTDGTLNFLTSLGFPNLLLMPNEGFLLLMLIANLLFICTILDVKANFHNANKIQYPLMVIMGLVVLVLAAMGITLISAIAFITASLLAWFYLFGLIMKMLSQGIAWAKYLLIAEVIMLLGSITALLAFHGYIPENIYTGVIAEKITSVLQLILFAVVIFEKNTLDAHLQHKKQLEDMVLKARQEIEESVAKSDPLTGVYSRPTLYDFGSQIIMESRRYDTNCSTLILAIDNFRNINVSFGHELGDKTLCHVADICQLLIRDCDIVGRLSDEELAIILPSTDSEGAGVLAERLRKEVEKSGVTEEFSNINMTVSIGVCQLEGDTERFEELINKTDQALFLAKSYGRNRVEIAK